jgi:hypothetical protein
VIGYGLNEPDSASGRCGIFSSAPRADRLWVQPYLVADGFLRSVAAMKLTTRLSLVSSEEYEEYLM